MPNNHRSFQTVLAAPLATGGTLTVGYPPGTSRTTFLHGVQHALFAIGGRYFSPSSITVALNAASAVITYNGATTIPAGTTVTVQLDAGGEYPNWAPNALDRRVKAAEPLRIDLGNPVAGAANAICLSQGVTAGVDALLNGATAGNLDVPRNVVAAWTTTAIATVEGFDEYGVAMTESSASGTSMTGVKAFARVTRVRFSANVTGATVGTGNVLGLPVFVPGTASLIRESQDLAAPTAGTLVGGLSAATRSTATTADVRGTYAPNATPNGTISYALLVLLEDPTHRGNPQFPPG
jgi:hypothetical protein